MTPKLPLRHRLVKGLITITGAAVVVIFVAGFASRSASRHAEYKWFEGQYGPARHSEHAEEWIIRDFFRDQRDGTFVDVGSAHYQTFSNTYYLEQTLGWSGVAIDAQEEFARDYAQHRPRTKFFS